MTIWRVDVYRGLYNFFVSEGIDITHVSTPLRYTGEYVRSSTRRWGRYFLSTTELGKPLHSSELRELL